MRAFDLRADRFSVENLPALEAIRWKYVLKYRAFIKGPHKDLFNKFPVGGLCYGYKVNEFQVNELICFQFDGEGLSCNLLREFDGYSGQMFVRCLPQDKLALYINSSNKKIQEAVNERLQGNGKPPIPFRQDIVDTYYRNEIISGRLLKVIGYVDHVISDHIRTLGRKIPDRFRYYEHVLALTINDRTYLQREDVYLPPETMMWAFTTKDIESEEVVDVDQRFKHQLSITPVSGGTHD
jgi:hypothetical protein